MQQRLKNQVAVVTGASKGIGAAIAKRLAAEGASVVVNYAASKVAAERVVADILQQGGQAIAVQADVSKAAEAARLLSATQHAFGAVDILVNNAGIYIPGTLAELDEAKVRKQYDLNVLGVLLTTQAALAHFNAAGGSVINISSVVSRHGMAALSAYSGTKGAVDAITRSLAKELAPKGIRVNAVNPGMVETEGLHDTGFIQNRSQVEAMTPLGRIGQPEDIAPAVAFFASAESAWITGETLTIAGGLR